MTKEEDYVRKQVVNLARCLPHDTFRSLMCRELEVRFTPRWKMLKVSSKHNRHDGWYPRWCVTQYCGGVTWHRLGLPYNDLVWRCSPKFSEFGRIAYMNEVCTNVEGLSGVEWASNDPLIRDPFRG